MNTILILGLLLNMSPVQQSQGKSAPRLQEDDFGWQNPSKRQVNRHNMDYWDFVGHAPFMTGRDGAWTSLMHVPAMTTADSYPVGQALAGVNLEYSSYTWSDNSQAGESRWDAILLTENIHLMYGLTEAIQIGASITTGELFQEDSAPIKLFDGAAQLIPDGRRGWDISTIVLNGKYVQDLGFAQGGIQVDVKIPLGDRLSLLTAGTLDVGVTGILGLELGDFDLTINAGVVYPLGDADIFLDSSKDELDPIVHAGAALSYPLFEDLYAVVQVEANTSPFGEISVLDETVIGIFASVRYRMMKYYRKQRLLHRSDEGYVGILLGTGFGELSNDLTIGINFDLSF